MRKSQPNASPGSAAAQRAVKLNEVILAEFEQERRQRSAPDQRDASYVRLLLALLVECDRPAVLTGLSASIANAVVDLSKRNVGPDLLLRFYPRESSTLHLATHRIRRLFAESAVRRPLDRFHASIATAKCTSLDAVIEGAPGTAGGTIVTSQDLMLYWRQAAKCAHELLTVTARELRSHDFSEAAPVKAPLLALLEEAMAGGHSAVGPDGAVAIPTWAERRRAERIPIGQAGFIVQQGHRRPVIISDLSATGVGLEAIALLETGEAVTVEIRDGLRFHGVVAWSCNQKAGVELRQSPQATDPLLGFINRMG